MLKELKINNYLLINDLLLDFSKGFTVITGETGAGKSILAGAIMLLSGEKTDAKMLCNIEKKCIIEGTFNIEPLHLQSFFEEQELDYLPETIIRREIIPGANRSRAFINDTPATAGQLKMLGNKLIDIHSQHETLQINNPVIQLQMIDQYGKLESAAESVKALFLTIKKQKGTLAEHTKQLQETLREQNFVSHALQELSNANIKQGEMEVLEQELQWLSNADALKTWLERVVYYCTEQDPSIVTLLKALENEGEKISIDNESFTQLVTRIRSVAIELQDVANDARHIQDHLNSDPEQLQHIEERLSFINSLIFKYHVRDVEQLFQLIDEYRAQTDNAIHLESEIAELKKQIIENESVLNQKALKLQADRKKLFSEIESKMAGLLQNLGMPDAMFQIHDETLPTPSESGFDKIKFLFTANKGRRPEGIGAVASGGELSRIMLAIKNLMSNTRLFPTMIFDEIDTGISGAVAVKTGEMLKNMSKNKQIVAITHLPTIAAFADRHLYVSKDSNNKSVQISVRYLSEKERITEIATMLSGHQNMQEAIGTATKLLYSAQKNEE